MSLRVRYLYESWPCRRRAMRAASSSGKRAARVVLFGTGAHEVPGRNPLAAGNKHPGPTKDQPTICAVGGEWRIVLSRVSDMWVRIKQRLSRGPGGVICSRRGSGCSVRVVHGEV